MVGVQNTIAPIGSPDSPVKATAPGAVGFKLDAAGFGPIVKRFATIGGELFCQAFGKHCTPPEQIVRPQTFPSDQRRRHRIFERYGSTGAFGVAAGQPDDLPGRTR